MPNINQSLNFSIVSTVHPFFSSKLKYWKKWRLTYESGEMFIYAYLDKFSKREDRNEFDLRRKKTYCPAFAKCAINEVRNKVYSKFKQIIRYGGAPSYLSCCAGLEGGVDRIGSDMNSYIGRRLLPELLALGKVGIFIDMPRLLGPTLAEKADLHPYIYMYRAEQIRSWSYNVNRPEEFTSVLLEDIDYSVDSNTGLITNIIFLYRRLWLDEDGFCWIQRYDSTGKALEPIQLGIKCIPFVVAELPDSLLSEAANYQIALLNMESSDLSYILKSNTPFYTEQYDPRADSLYLKSPGDRVNIVQTDKINHFDDLPGNAPSQPTSIDTLSEVRVGSTVGRRYPINTERPAFISPSSEPLTISMAKQKQMKEDMKELVNSQVAMLADEEGGVDAGLAYIGMILQIAEQRLALIWHQYEGYYDEVTTINYPVDYKTIDEKVIQEEVNQLAGLMPKIASPTLQKEIAKLIVEKKLSHKLPIDILETIYDEIDSSKSIVSDPDIIKTDIENGLVSLDLASKLRCYPPGEVEKAEADHARRVARIAISQTQGMAAESRGVNDLKTTNDAPREKAASRDTTMQDVPTDNTRGNALRNSGTSVGVGE